ncbi:MAG TPA: NAD(P)-dependent oxidoreductase [Patescibacteria group bacterium]
MTDGNHYKIAFFGVKSWERPIIEREIARLDTYGIGLFESEVQDSIELAAQYEIISPHIYSKMDKTVLEKLPKLKLIATRSTGVDHIDMKECSDRGIRVMNVAEYGSNTIAEYTLAMLLAITKKIVVAHQSVENGEFSPEGLTGVDLSKKTLGVIGIGKIGQNVVRIARGFGMKVVGVERSVDPVFAKRLGFRPVDLETCLKESDFVTLHVPSTPDTFHLINRSNIKLMKPGSYLVNTCRGPVVETEAIIWALNKKILAGAALDVTEEENNVENISMVTSRQPSKEDLQEILSYHLLRDRDDVVFTPHNAFNTKEALEKIIETTVDNIRRFVKENRYSTVAIE